MPTSRRRRSSSALAGWVFADLALILSFIFLNSDITGTAADVGSSSPTTVDVKRAKGGADPVPTNINVAFTAKTSRAELIRRVEKALSDKETVVESSRPFLVVIIYGGTRGGSNSQGDIAAERAKELLSGYWPRLVKGVTYFVLGHDGNSAVGTIQMKLFPVSDLDVD